jgi:hypothetical protein
MNRQIKSPHISEDGNITSFRKVTFITHLADV